jgi:hypothetical protein
MTYVIGIIGYCHPTKFDIVDAWEKVDKLLSEAALNKKDVLVLGGLTDIPSIHSTGYYIARQKGWKVGGIAPQKAIDFKWFPMNTDGDILKIVGNTWGDESEEFINSIDALVKIGGGKQSTKELEMATKRGIPIFQDTLEGKQ